MERFSALKQRLDRECPGLELREGEPLSRHTSFRIGGPAALMAFPETEEQTHAVVTVCAREGVRPLVMGNGSNLLAPDEGVDAFVLNTCALRMIDMTGEGTLRAGAGVTLARLAMFAAEHDLTGLEFAHGIPGTLGGAITMNAGAYGGEMAQVVVRTNCLTWDGTPCAIEGAAQEFSYRRSLFSGGEYLILSAQLCLIPGDGAESRRAMAELAERRRQSQPLEYPSAGSMFKRPAGHYAAALIDRCGLKGLTVGGAQVSEKHAGFVVNRGNATCRDVLELVEQVRARVLEQTGVELEMEVKVLGESPIGAAAERETGAEG